MCSPNGEPYAWQNGPLPGKLQTVPRAELHALTVAIGSTDGDLIVTTDSEYVYKGFQRGAKWKHLSNVDMWPALWQASDGRKGSFQLFWGPSHVLANSLVSGTQWPWQAFANELADHIADKAAASCQVPWDTARIIRWHDLRAKDVIRRLVAVHKLYSDTLSGSHFKSAEGELSHVVSDAEAKPSEQPVCPTSNSSSSTDFPSAIEPLSAEVIELLRHTSHKPIRSGAIFKCRGCHKTCPIRGPMTRTWLKAKCLVVRPDWFHPSHDHRFFEPVHYCAKCGFFAQSGKGSHSLGMDCKKEATRKGRANLKAFLKGKILK